MRKFLSLAVMCSLAFPAMAFGQEIRAEEEMKELEKAEEAQETAEEAPTEPEKLVTPVQKPEGVPVAPKRQAELGFGRGDGSFINGLTYLAMASAYYRIGGYIGEGVRAGSYNNLLDDGVVLDPVTGDPVPELAGAPLGYPYSNYNGFGLNFVGGSIAYYGQRFGVTVDLRFGEGANLLTPLVPVKQGFATWIAKKGELVIDLGFFDTIFGAEVADEWENANYSRGALYFLRQPFNHMGARMSAKLADRVAFTFMTTNGGVLGGQPIDDNETPTLSWQFGFDNAEENIGLFFGALHGASGIDGNKAWEHLFDIVFNANAGLFTLIYNGDFQVNPYTTNTNTGSRDLSFLYGNSLAMIFDVSDLVSIGVRGEHLSGNDTYRINGGDGFGGLATGTLTLRIKPVQYLVISLEGRGEWATRSVYLSRAAQVDDVTGALVPDKKSNYAAIIGMTAYIGN